MISVVLILLDIQRARLPIENQVLRLFFVFNIFIKIEKIQ